VELVEQHGIELTLCISSALRRGMLDPAEAERHEKHAASVHPAFTIAGLGQLVDACARSDRLVTFGG
jgi:tRNA 2-thiouridine synthesizing protein D